VLHETRQSSQSSNSHMLFLIFCITRCLPDVYAYIHVIENLTPRAPCQLSPRCKAISVFDNVDKIDTSGSWSTDKDPNVPYHH